jgi:putative acetyltransferase
MMEYSTAHITDEYAAAAQLFREYAAAININLDFQHFDEELDELQQMYAPPLGGIILCRDAEKCIACVGVRWQADEVAELKRMFVQPTYQGKGIGAVLLRKALALAMQCGYKKIRLDTLNTMLPAMALYKKHGFYEIPAYYHNPIPTVVYFEKEL